MTKKLLVLALIAVIVAALVPAALADQQDPVAQSAYPWLSECTEDLTGENITFYHFGDLSGSFAFITQPLLAGFEDAAELANSKGGLCGATIAQEYRDTAGKQEQSQAFWDEFSAKSDAYTIFLYASADAELLREQAAEKKIPLLVSAGSEKAFYGEDGASPSYGFGIIPLYTDQLGLFCDFISENWATIAEERGIEGDPVIGHLSWEGAFGRSSDTDETRAYCESKGVGYAGAAYFLPGTPDISTQMQGLLDKGANILYTTSLASGPAQVATTAQTLGASAIIAGSNWALDTSVIGLAGEASNGIYGNLPFLWWDELTEPAVQEVVAVWSEKRLAADPESAIRLRNIAYITTFGSLDLYMEAMIRTINRVGYANLTGEEFYNTLTEMQYDAFNGIIRVDYTDGKRATRQTRPAQIQFVQSASGVTPSVVPLGDWGVAPDLRPGGADTVK